MDGNLSIGLNIAVRDILDGSHYENLKKHIKRTSAKYKKIKFFVEVLADDGTAHQKAKHLLIDSELDVECTDEIERAVIDSLRDVYKILTEHFNIFCAGIVSGENDPGTYILPLLHVLVQWDDKIDNAFLQNILFPNSE